MLSLGLTLRTLKHPRLQKDFTFLTFFWKYLQCLCINFLHEKKCNRAFFRAGKSNNNGKDNFSSKVTAWNGGPTTLTEHS